MQILAPSSRLLFSVVLLILFSFSFFVSTPIAAYAQEGSDLYFDFVFDLGSPGLQTFHQDVDGFLWIGTRGGLFRYDGYELKHYEAGPSGLSNGHIYGLIEDPVDPNILWIGTKGGLNRLDEQTETYRYYQHDPDDENSLSNNGINHMIQDGQDPNILWIGSDGGLDRFDKDAGHFTRYGSDPGDPNSLLCPQVWRIVEDASDPDVLWIATWGCGLQRFDKRTESFTHYVHDPDDPESLGAVSGVLTGIAQDRDDPNVLWIGTLEHGLDRFDKRAGTFVHYTHDPQDHETIPAGVVALIYDDGQGRLWLGGWVDDNGLTLFDKQTGVFTNYRHDPNDPHSLSGNHVVNVYEDRTGIFWITTLSGKVDKYDPWQQRFELYQHQPNNPQSLINNAVTTMHEDRAGRIWLGTQGGLSRFDAQTGTFTNYAPNGHAGSLPANYVWDIEEDASGDLWLSHFPGPLARFDGDAGRVTAVYTYGVESFTQIIQDPDDADVLWLGMRPGIFARFEKSTETLTPYSPAYAAGDTEANEAFVYVGLHDRHEDVIWLGGWEGGGLLRFDKRAEAFRRYLADPDDPISLSSDAIASMYQEPSGVLWLGTLGGGLERFDPASETFTHYTETHGVPAVVSAVLFDGADHLWLSSDDGLLEFDPQAERVERRYGESAGLQGDAFLQNSALRAGDGALWFGGTNGVNRFHPDQLITNPHVPPVVLTAFTQGGEPVSSDVAPHNLRAVDLDWRHNFFEFEYAALNFTQPEKNRYAYMLEGMDKEWYEAGERRFGRYTGLRGGMYVLRVRGSNNDGVWNDEGVAVRINVRSPVWQSWWFYGAVAAVVFGVLGGMYWMRTQQLESERAAASTLMESEERLRQVVRNMPVLMNAFDDQGNILIWNRECERVTGYSAEEMIGNPDALALLYPDPEYRHRVMSAFQERDRDLRNWETEVVCKDGSTKIVAWSNISRQFPIPGWAEWAIGVDVTERKRAERTREHMLARIRQIIETVPEGVLLLDVDGYVHLANPEAERCLEILAHAAVDQAITHLGDRSLTELLTSPPTRGLWHEVKAGRRTFEVIARPMENGSYTEDWVMLVRDVSQEREVQNRVQQQERLAALGQLAAGIAHDFNNILATIILYAQMIERAGGLSRRSREQAATIHRQAGHATRLIQQILDFSRRSVVERHPLDILAFTKEFVQMLERTLPENIQVKLSYDSGLYTVNADPTRIQQMLTNLALNARDAMRERGGVLHIILRQIYVARQKSAPLPEMKPGEWIQIDVSDTGTGIKSDVMPHIFEPFFTTKPPGEGSGLGLPQVHGIVGTHEGHIDVESEWERGSTFTVYLPAIPDPSMLPQDEAPPASVQGHGETILVVEDSPTTRQALVESLDALRYHTLTAADGREALDILRQRAGEIDLVLSDVVMPSMGGVALAHALYEQEFDVRILLMTGHPLEQSLSHLRDYGVVDVISKPVSFDLLAEVVARGLKHEC